MGRPKEKTYLTIPEYFAIERQSEFRSEYFKGEMFAMAGGSPRHSRVKTCVLAELERQLKQQPCVPYDSDLRVLCPTGLYTYPDASVVCGALDFDDDQQNAVVNPTLIVEVLSKSTEQYDRGKKFDHYRSIDSLREYVLISQDEPMVQTYLRNADGSWTWRVANQLEQSIRLNSIGCELRLADVYDRVVFDAEADVPLPETTQESVQ